MSAINKLSDRGMFFWDYGNAFLLEASRAGNVRARLSLPAAVLRDARYSSRVIASRMSL